MQTTSLIPDARSLLHIVLATSLAQACVAQSADDCSPRQLKSGGYSYPGHGCRQEDEKIETTREECIAFGNPKHTSAFSKFEIDKPGHYCLTEDLHPRFDMADHPAESAMIIVRASDVVLDLQGHTLGRGRLFKNPGATGVSIRDARNVLIRNGVLQDFDRAIFRLTRYPSGADVEEISTYDARNNTYRFPITNIVIENLIFKNNKKDMAIEVKKDMTP